MKKSYIKKFTLFMSLNWMKITITFMVMVILSMIIFGIRAFISIDSYMRQTMVAQGFYMLPSAFIHSAVFVGMYTLILRGGFSRLKSKRVKGKKVNISFDDVVGLEEPKLEAMEVVSLIRDHKRIKHIGGKIIKGILMIGPPGCGKTLLAKAIATEAKIPFLPMVGSEFVEVFVGVGASRVRTLFKKARAYARAEGACIIFIDELDVIATARTFHQFGGQETNSTQNQLLAEMDGLRGKSENVIVIGATNADIKTLDPALLRPGRFDRKIRIDRPLAEDRENLFKFYLNKVSHNPKIDCKRLGNFAIGKSPADIENVVKEAAIIATRDNRELVEYTDITAAIDRIELGLKRKRKIPEKERKNTAYHEAGHALIIYYHHPIDDVFKLTILTREQTLGVCFHQPLEELMGYDSEVLTANIKASLAGYVAERLKFGKTSTGVSSDFRNATSIAQSMVWELGMGANDFVGNFALPVLRSSDELSHLSDSMKEQLNNQVKEILENCVKEVLDFLSKEQLLLDKLAEALLEKDELEYNEIDKICLQYGVTKERRIAKDGLLQQFRDIMEDSLDSKIDTNSDSA